jgi:Ca2+-binding RTX toxin-like protein
MEITNPIPNLVPKSTLSVQLREIYQLPDSGTGTNLAARLNFLTTPNDGSDRLFVNDTRGKLYQIQNGQASVYLDLKFQVGASFKESTPQQGFTYFTFHPDFAHNGLFYTVHSEIKGSQPVNFPVTKTILNNQGQPIASSHHDVIREWKATNPTANIFAGTVREIARIEQPYPDHNTGQLGFNPNAKPGDADYGLLYIAQADGGSDGFPVGETDPIDNGQDLNTPLGKILRIDPGGINSANGKYGIPNDNPFVSDGNANTLREIWAYGLRNPHRFSWDTQGQGKMLISDIGQAFIEEVNLGVKGENYGWDQREGTWMTDQNNEHILYSLPSNDPQLGYTYPVAQYDRDIPPNYQGSFAVAIAGGYVYRGSVIPELQGQYIFGDFGNDGRFFHVPASDLTLGTQTPIKELRLFDETGEKSFLEIIGDPRSDVRFGVDNNQEIFVTSKRNGKIYQLISSPEFNSQTRLYVNDIQVLEGSDTQANFTVKLSVPSLQTVTVNYKTQNGTATAGNDYTTRSGVLTFNPGETSQVIAVPILNNTVFEVNETFSLQLSNPTNAELAKTQGTATVTDFSIIPASANTILASNIEGLILTGTGNLNGTGNTSSNQLVGNSGNNNFQAGAGEDTLLGYAGNDRLDGGSGSDSLYGGEGNDSLFGRQDNDLLVGESGQDTLTGGAGLDTFAFNTSSEGVDRIQDFFGGRDRLQIKASGFGGNLNPGILPPDQFVLGTAALDASDRLIYQQSSGNLWFDVDGTGSIAPIHLAILSNRANLAASQIAIVS